MEHAHRPRLAVRGPRTVLLVHSSAGRYGADRQLQALATGLHPDRWRPHVVLAEDGPLVDDLRAAGVPATVRGLAVLRREHLSAAGLARVGASWVADAAGLGRAGRVRVLPDGLALSPDPTPRAQARALLGLPADAWVVALLGRLSAWKGQGLLVDALSTPALADDPAVVAVLAGDSWRDAPAAEAELRARAAARGVGDRVLLPGFVDRPGLLYAAADVIAVPSTRPDPLPNAALEAAAAGRCVVAADHGGLREILDGGRCGVLVRPGDARALGVALAGLRADPGRAAMLGERAAVDVPRRFGPAALAARIQDLYDEVLLRRGALS